MNVASSKKVQILNTCFAYGLSKRWSILVFSTFTVMRTLHPAVNALQLCGEWWEKWVFEMWLKQQYPDWDLYLLGWTLYLDLNASYRNSKVIMA